VAVAYLPARFAPVKLAGSSLPDTSRAHAAGEPPLHVSSRSSAALATDLLLSSGRNGTRPLVEWSAQTDAPRERGLVREVDVEPGAEAAADRRLPTWRGPSRRTLRLVVARRPATTLSCIVGYLGRN